jgi:hypothetical protein
VAVGLVLVFVAAGFILYPVTRDAYVSYREKSRIEAEYQAILDRNAAIQARIDHLETLEGIEDRAREQFGWVREGEEAVNITGLQTAESSTVLPESVAAGSIAPTSDWLSQILDALFGYEYRPPEHLSPEYELIPGL